MGVGLGVGVGGEGKVEGGMGGTGGRGTEGVGGGGSPPHLPSVTEGVVWVCGRFEFC